MIVRHKIGWSTFSQKISAEDYHPENVFAAPFFGNQNLRRFANGPNSESTKINLEDIYLRKTLLAYRVAGSGLIDHN